MSETPPLPPGLGALIDDYRAQRAPQSIDHAVHAELAARRLRRRPSVPLLALAASAAFAAVLALWLVPQRPPTATTADAGSKPRVATAIVAPPSLAGKRPKARPDVRRGVRFPALGTPPRLTRPKPVKETRHVQS